MGSSNIKAQGRSQSHVTPAFMYFLKEKINRNLTLQHELLDLVQRCVYKSMYA